LSEIHAKVRDTYDGSFIADERPANVPVNKRTTRFGSTRVNDIQARVAEAVDKASYDVYGTDSRSARMDNNTRNSTNVTLTSNTFPDTGTHQSFLLPDLPNLSELVSGVYENGAPVFPGKNKSRTTRFVSPPHDGGEPSYVRYHRPVDAVPIPEDEKALFVSLRLLQDKVAELELARSETEKRLEDMREENATLKADKARRQKEQYSRLRAYGSDEEEYGQINRKLSSEKSRMYPSLFSKCFTD
jgi:regulator of replication initiation timing